jgi:hypothetical protein
MTPEEMEKALRNGARTHLTTYELAAYLERELGPIANARTERHLKVCVACSRRRSFLEEGTAYTSGARSEAQGGDDLAHIRRLVRDHMASLEKEESGCEPFRSTLAKFGRISEADTALPGFIRHLESCFECRRLFWTAKKVWTTQTDTRGINKHAPALHVEFGINRRLVERGPGPPPVEHQKYAAAAGHHFEARALVRGALRIEPEDDTPVRIEWELKDDDANFAIRLIVTGFPSGKVTLGCAVESSDDTLNIERARLEIPELSIAGRLTTLLAKPLELRPELGSSAQQERAPQSWRIKIILRDSQPARSWEIPVVLEWRTT